MGLSQKPPCKTETEEQRGSDRAGTPDPKEEALPHSVVTVIVRSPNADHAGELSKTGA